MTSKEKEFIKYHRAIDVNEGEKKGQVEKWLLEILEVMKETLNIIAEKCYFNMEFRS